jgi:hypothetical protein
MTERRQDKKGNYVSLSIRINTLPCCAGAISVKFLLKEGVRNETSEVRRTSQRDLDRIGQNVCSKLAPVKEKSGSRYNIVRRPIAEFP